MLTTENTIHTSGENMSVLLIPRHMFKSLSLLNMTGTGRRFEDRMADIL